MRKCIVSFGVNEVVRNLDKETLREYLNFRINFIKEEYDELVLAAETADLDNIVDSIIDLLVVGIGTLDAFDVDTTESWDRVLKANMAKEPGSNPNRPNRFGFPDMLKPPGWEGPDHTGNYGLISKAYE